MKNIAVVGAGIAGLTIAYKLAEKGHKVTLIEKESQVGGLARSFIYGDFVFDIGPHRFHTDKPDVLKFIKFVLGDKSLTIDRTSGVYLFGKYHPWPIRPKTILNLPFTVLVKAAFDLFNRTPFESERFSDYIVSKYGKTLYNCFFKDYTEKFSFVPAPNLHYTWATASIDRAVIDKRLRMDSLFDTLRIALMPKPVKTKFLYPYKGVYRFSENLASMIKKKGGKIFTNVSDIKVNYKEDRIDSISFGDTTLKTDLLVWTAPITEISGHLNLGKPNLNYLDILIYNIEIKKDLGDPNQWIYFGDRDLVFTRISLPKNFSKNNVPEGKDALCVEVTVKDKNIWENPKSIIGRVISDLEKVKMCKKEDIGNIHIERITNTYPIYELNYKKELEEIKKKLSGFKNLICSGRTGAFYYNNMDNSIDMGLKLVDGL
ncbi:FAD-dependent oxidoreductase [Candidatus Woesearchaeota archaeon]|nr:FAD-dependent oxidoreductase [Candidatus Woesearchaeota archaeon]